MTDWSNLANSNPFKPVKTTDTNLEVSASEEVTIVDEAAYVERYVVQTTDGRTVPVIVDNGTRSVYPVRDTKA